MNVKVTELGMERRCNRCKEWWPLDEEFYHRHANGLAGFNGICRACRTMGYRRRIDEDRILAMLAQGRSVPEIALAVGCSVGAVYARRAARRAAA